MRPIAFALPLLWMTCAAVAQEAMARYESAYFKTGVLLRASAVCGGSGLDAKKIIGKAFAGISSAEYKKVSRAYPDTTKKWMMSGAAAFNNAVMSKGVEVACKKATR